MASAEMGMKGDPRPLPEGKIIAGAIADIFDALVATLSDTRLEPDLWRIRHLHRGAWHSSP